MRSERISLLAIAVVASLLIAGCGSDPGAPTEAPRPLVVTVVVTQPAPPTPASEGDAPEPPPPTEAAYPAPEQVNTQAVHQQFERGDAIWLADRLEIWFFVQPYTLVIDALATPTGPRFLSSGGPLLIFEDTFDPAVEAESDPEIVAPEGFLQPKGGIGKVWRGNPELRAMLGWALDWELPYEATVTTYSIEPDRTVQTVLTPDERLLFVHRSAGIWSAGQ